MKLIIKKAKIVFMILSSIILFNGCTIYKRSGVTLEEAHTANKRTRVETSSGELLKFNYIEYENGTYYGVKNSNGRITKVALNKDYINKVEVKSNGLSIIGTLIIPLTLIVVVVGLTLGVTGSTGFI